MLRLPHRQSDPASGQDASEVPMGEERGISVQSAETGNEAVSTVGNLGGRFTARTAVPKEIPVRSRPENVRRALSFVVAIIPLRQVRFDFGRRIQPGQLTRSSRALQRAGQHASKRDVPEALSKLPRPVLAVSGQGNVRATRVLAGERPLGFTVSNEVNAREHIVPVDDLRYFRISGAVHRLLPGIPTGMASFIIAWCGRPNPADLAPGIPGRAVGRFLFVFERWFPTSGHASHPSRH